MVVRSFLLLILRILAVDCSLLLLVLPFSLSLVVLIMVGVVVCEVAPAVADAVLLGVVAAAVCKVL